VEQALELHEAQADEERPAPSPPELFERAANSEKPLRMSLLPQALQV
jgi:hypothetical protein